MNNTDKLLRAFIEASGYEIETKVTSQELHNPHNSNVEIITSTDYKVTKKVSIQHDWYDGVTLNDLVKNIIILSNLEDQYKFIKYPKESFHAVIDWFGDDAIRCNEHRYNIFNVEVGLDENI